MASYQRDDQNAFALQPGPSGPRPLTNASRALFFDDATVEQDFMRYKSRGGARFTLVSMAVFVVYYIALLGLYVFETDASVDRNVFKLVDRCVALVTLVAGLVASYMGVYRKRHDVGRLPMEEQIALSTRNERICAAVAIVCGGVAADVVGGGGAGPVDCEEVVAFAGVVEIGGAVVVGGGGVGAAVVVAGGGSVVVVATVEVVAAVVDGATAEVLGASVVVSSEWL